MLLYQLLLADLWPPSERGNSLLHKPVQGGKLLFYSSLPFLNKMNTVVFSRRGFSKLQNRLIQTDISSHSSSNCHSVALYDRRLWCHPADRRVVVVCKSASFSFWRRNEAPQQAPISCIEVGRVYNESFKIHYYFRWNIFLTNYMIFILLI